ncbi:hypothetical protein SEA_GOIB_3 [Gordonia phage Goib]|uniref:Uncharacterized protein n=2 Tax=Vendettavirus vendetta TaxID=2049886 RepID=A0A160DCZ6_9CAUD|nr:hypothetical protein BH795_gp03 [Gordonia phage Vendetta]YP_009275358.1 hypothetical protein BH760_gp03 [Gordonia phage Splinter]ANA85551.1 hypothetical protein PBI_VENDETTA_3 [Gordonia phage Vendetta]ANA85630.1 hypothetical protein PBI_SPLINTER_3 [Gordonia phage Splinter]WNO25747.1 hypothetical protein SEA_GOIB_3 [Gordonia phage Goib]
MNTTATATARRASDCRYCRRYSRACGRPHDEATRADWSRDETGRTPAEARARAFAIEHSTNLVQNVAACGGEWLVNGFVQSARNHDVDPEALRVELAHIARTMNRHDVADKLDGLAGKVA